VTADPIYTGTAQLISGGWSRPNPYCETCEPHGHAAVEAEPDDAVTYVTLCIPSDKFTLGARDRYELTILPPAGADS
jgi:hypothetical protein